MPSGSHGRHAQEALEKAYEADVAGDVESARKRYRVGLQAIQEGLKQRAAESGLGPAYDNVARWKLELATWEQLVQDRWAASPPAPAAAAAAAAAGCVCI